MKYRYLKIIFFILRTLRRTEKMRDDKIFCLNTKICRLELTRMFCFILRLRQNSKSTKFDKKYLVFGEKEEEGEEAHILGIIKRTLREALDGLLTNAEVTVYRTLCFFGSMNGNWLLHECWFKIQLVISLSSAYEVLLCCRCTTGLRETGQWLALRLYRRRLRHVLMSLYRSYSPITHSQMNTTTSAYKVHIVLFQYLKGVNISQMNFQVD